MPKTKKRYIVFGGTDFSEYTVGRAVTLYATPFETEAEAEDYARTSTAQGGSATLAVTTKLLKPKPVEMITVELAEEC